MVLSSVNTLIRKCHALILMAITLAFVKGRRLRNLTASELGKGLSS